MAKPDDISKQDWEAAGRVEGGWNYRRAFLADRSVLMGSIARAIATARAEGRAEQLKEPVAWMIRRVTEAGQPITSSLRFYDPTNEARTGDIVTPLFAAAIRKGEP